MPLHPQAPLGARLTIVLMAAAACLGKAPALAADAAPEASSHPRDSEIRDPDTRAWWHTTEALSGDAMEGRDTGSPAYQRAAGYVAARLEAAGLKPAGDGGTYFQSVPMHEVTVNPQTSRFTLTRPDGSTSSLVLLQQITIAAAADLPQRLEGHLAFRGYCGREAMTDVDGRFVVCFGTQRRGLPSAADRATAARAGHALGLITIDDPYFDLEPPRWPSAYARSVTLREPAARPDDVREPAAALPLMRLSAAAADLLFVGSGQNAAALLESGGRRQPLPNVDLPGSLEIVISVTQRDIASPNVLAILPGTDANLRRDYAVLAAHLDGYGRGTAVKGDDLYNGTLDDAAYVALLIQLADDVKAGRLPPMKRSLLLAAFTGEEKGLLGSTWFVAHPTVPLQSMAAAVNLDQLRPLFPPRILTAEALADSSLGDTARAVAAPRHIEIRADAEPERNLLRRADQYPFLVRHVPAISFVFGYDPGTEAEKRYREWYQLRYHRPQDDLTQPVDFDAATQFDEFFYALVAAIANAPTRPWFYPTSSFAAAR